MKPSRIQAATDFFVTVPGIGRFLFAKRKMADEMQIAVEYSLLTQGIDTPSSWLGIMAGAVSQLSVLTVTAPDGWDLEEMDPLDEETYDKIIKVHRALREQETSFRQKPTATSKEGGEGNSEGAGVLVPEEVQPSTD